jgi:ribosome maturation protein SDO1
MVSLDDAVVARLNRFGTTFEILVDPEAAEGITAKSADDEILKVLAVDDVFVDWSEGERASSEQLQKGFETETVAVIARRILAEGEIQLTQEQRKKMLEAKRRRVVDHIARHAWDPRARTPHPRDRIERALDEAKWRADALRPVEVQVQEAFKVLRPLLPIAFERVRVAIKIPSTHAGAAYGKVRGLGDLKREEWQSDGALIVVLEIPAGAQTDVYDILNHFTHGEAETRLLD